MPPTRLGSRRIPTTCIYCRGNPVLIAGEGPETNTLRLNYGNIYLFKDSPDSPIEPTSPAEPLNTGVFLFKGNRASYNVEMRNIYVLSDDGSRFELKDRVTLRPFESYVVANAATQALLKSLRLDGIVTGTELAETPADNSFALGPPTDVCTLAPTMPRKSPYTTSAGP